MLVVGGLAKSIGRTAQVVIKVFYNTYQTEIK